MKRLAGAAAAALLLAVGCNADGEEEAKPPPPPPEPAAADVLAEIERTRPGVVLRDFVRAAARRDVARMWERLSEPSRQRLGPTRARFGRSAAAALGRDLRQIGGRHELVLSQAITATFAVAAVQREERVYAAALRLERGLWRVELGAPIRIEPLRPKPGETVLRRTQLAAEVTAGAPVVEAGLWLDGVAFPSRGGGPTPNALTMFGETTTLRAGRHHVVAFASTASNAAARAWPFRAKVR